MIKKVLKKKTLPMVVEPVKLQYIPAIEMEDGVAYVNPLGTVILRLKKIIPYEGVETGVLSVIKTIVVCTGQTDLGEMIESRMHGTAPVLCDRQDLEKKILHSYNVYVGKVKDVAKVKAANKPPKTDADGNVVVKQPRGVVDPVSGCSAGSQGHVLGMIMIKNKCSPTTRPICIAEMTECLMKDFGLTDEKKAKSLASSWYSTNYIRKPTYYAKKW